MKTTTPITKTTIESTHAYDRHAVEFTIPEPTKSQILGAIQNGDIHKFNNVTRDFTKMQITCVSHVHSSPLLLCLTSKTSSMQVFRELCGLYTSNQAMWVPHNNDLLYAVLDDNNEFVSSNKVEILDTLINKVQIPVIPEPQLQDQIKNISRKLRRAISNRAASYEFAHELTAAYQLNKKRKFSQLVSDNPHKWNSLPSRYPRFLSMAINERRPDWVEFLIDEHNCVPTVSDYYSAFGTSKYNKEINAVLLQPQLRPSLITNAVITGWMKEAFSANKPQLDEATESALDDITRMAVQDVGWRTVVLLQHDIRMSYFVTY